MSDYRSIFWEADWQHARYLGWADGWPEPGLRVMEKRQGPLIRRLALSDVRDPARLAALLKASDPGAMGELVIHDFTGEPAVITMLGAWGAVPLAANQRLLNIATFVIDLAPDEDALLAAMSSDTRRKLRKAEAAGLTFDDGARATSADLVSAFNRMAAERGLHGISQPLVEQMIADGAARLYSVWQGDALQTMLLAYRAGDKAIFLQGAAAVEKDNDGAGVLLQWGVIRALKGWGLRWYDMGGLPSLDSSNGIYRFKKGFGGELVDLGAEYGKTGTLMRLARKVTGR